MHRSKKLALFITLAIMLACTSGVVILWFSDTKEWTVSAIEDRIGAQLPSSATNIHTWVSDAPGDELLYIEFDVPLYEGDSFARHFCDGHLEAGMNPFDHAGYLNSEATFIPDHPTNPLEYGFYCDTHPITRLLIDRSNGIDEVALEVWFP